ncbi:MAG TPA: PQQ-binding-like beta-propeller repeat protein [Ktedonobacteraceae bacterium]|nr:PQQ-binding-like beta-propeller repeat protein [Ktedonobacteraceae bacterium]
MHWTRTITAPISAEPVEANGMIYWGSWDGLEHGSSLTNGSDVWTAQLGTSTGVCASQPHGVTSSATIATEVIGGVSTPVDYVGGGNATFYALNANTGAVIWQTALSTQTGAYLWSSPAVDSNGSVYVGLSSLMDCPLVRAGMVQLNAVTGAIQNTYYTVPTACAGASVWGSPTIDDTLGMVYFATGNGGPCASTETMADAVIALSTTNLSLLGSWQVPSTSQITDGDFGATPTLFSATIGGVSHQMLGLQNKNGTYYAFDRTNISAGPLWQSSIASPTSTGQNISSSAWDGTNLYVASGATTINGIKCRGSLNAVNPSSGAFIWQDCLTADPLAPVIAVPGLAVVGYGNLLRIANSATGKFPFTYKDTTTNSNFWGPASISNGVLYIGNRDGNLYAFGR